MKSLSVIYMNLKNAYKIIMWPGVSIVAWFAFLAVIHFINPPFSAEISTFIRGVVDAVMMGHSHGFDELILFIMLALIKIVGLWIYGADRAVKSFIVSIKTIKNYLMNGNKAYR